MALSNSVNFTMTASELIENAFSKIGIKKMEQPLLAPELQDGLDNLNLMMLARWVIYKTKHSQLVSL